MALLNSMKDEINQRTAKIIARLSDASPEDRLAEAWKIALLEKQIELLDSIDSRLLSVESQVVGDQR